jgi:hypothetical protein
MLEKVDIGNRYGQLLVIGCSGLDSHRNRLWLCLCDCGNTARIRTTELRRGSRKSCGCLRLGRLKSARGKPLNVRALDRFLTGGRFRPKKRILRIKK